MLTRGRGAVLFVTQLLGGITAAALIDVLTPGPLSVANGLGRKCLILKHHLLCANIYPKAGVNVAQGLFMEMFLTAELILAIFMVGIQMTPLKIILI